MIDVRSLGAIAVYVAAEGIVVSLLVFGQDRLALADGARGELPTSHRAARRAVWYVSVAMTLPAVIVVGVASGRGLTANATDVSFVFVLWILAAYRLETAGLRGIGEVTPFVLAKLAFGLTKLAILWGGILLIPWTNPQHAQAIYAFALACASGIGVAIARFTRRLPSLQAPVATGPGSLRRQFAVGFPLLLHGFALSALIFLDRMMLGAWTDFTTVGLYATAYIPASALTYVYSYTAVVREPLLVRVANSELSIVRIESEAKSYHRRLVRAGIMAILVGALSAPALAQASAVDISAVTGLYLVLAAAHLTWPGYLTANALLLARNNSHLLAVASLGSLLLNAALNTILIPWASSAGAASATLISYVALSYASVRAARRSAAAFAWLRTPAWLTIVASCAAAIGLLVFFGV
jgi:O-antigen/teichoic acid export membrane protein